MRHRGQATFPQIIQALNIYYGVCTSTYVSIWHGLGRLNWVQLVARHQFIPAKGSFTINQNAVQFVRKSFTCMDALHFKNVIPHCKPHLTRISLNMRINKGFFRWFQYDIVIWQATNYLWMYLLLPCWPSQKYMDRSDNQIWSRVSNICWLNLSILDLSVVVELW